MPNLSVWCELRPREKLSVLSEIIFNSVGDNCEFGHKLNSQPNIKELRAKIFFKLY